MQTRLLTPEEFKATHFSPARVEDSTPTPDFWIYVQAIPAEHFGIFDCREGQVTHVYRMGDEFEHVLINSQYQGVAMVIVVDLSSNSVHGHYLLDVNPPGTQIPEENA
ncbi:MAG: hypothetical protein C9355_02535 [Thalassolituus maritimus]|uniref:Uncharacterized protein n=1 Tax=Thalassolituus maritimus TaxID=484498 RepID=A0A1N7J759_9GAMM|nr:hypothetical protein [Thalassolituus maritimus]TPD55611.1 MAG: hypothetical protein C9355_02535 [Thalassolituus maritimus]SIS45081.1 hypothetical protein SAMN05421686_101425 [Thalassolituus maritimus]